MSPYPIYPHCDPSSTHISALLALRLFFIFAPRRALSVHLFRLLQPTSSPSLFCPPRLREHARLWLWGLGESTIWLVRWGSPGFRLVRSSGSISREPRQSGSHWHTHRPHRLCFRRFGRTSSAHTEGARVSRGGACRWPWKRVHFLVRATSDARTRCGTCVSGPQRRPPTGTTTTPRYPDL